MKWFFHGLDWEWVLLKDGVRRVVFYFFAGLLTSCSPWDEGSVEAGNGMTKYGEVRSVDSVRAVIAREARFLPTREPGAASGGEKWLSGAVTFRGLSEGQLADFAVIPEGSSLLFQPKNGRYTQVDGFWWRGDRVNWYKIPDHAEAWVVGVSGVKPTDFSGLDERGDLSIYRKSLRGVGLTSALRGGVSEAGFYPRSGKTMIGAVYPF